MLPREGPAREPDDIVDVHTHAFPDFLAPKALALLQQQGTARACLEGTVAALLSSMDRNGIAVSVVSSVATTADQFSSILEWSGRIAGPRIVPFPSVLPRSPDALAGLGTVAAQGFRGIKLHPEYQGFYADEPELADFYRSAQEEGLIILFHAGYDIGFPDSDRSAPERILQVHNSFPHLRIIASHLGGFRRWQEVARLLVGRDIYLDTSYVFGHIQPRLLEEIIDGHRPDRILFGSDSPWAGQAETIRGVRRLGLDPQVERGIFSVNARELLAL